MAGKKYENLTQLCGRGEIPASPEAAVLETVPNPNPGTDYLVRFACPEFTALCPVTGQPDFAHLVIDYVPAKKLVESKSLKLYSRPSATRRLSRGMHAGGGPQGDRGGETEVAAHRRLLVPAGRYPHRRFLADRRTTQGPVGARPGRRVLSREGIGGRHTGGRFVIQ